MKTLRLLGTVNTRASLVVSTVSNGSLISRRCNQAYHNMRLTLPFQVVHAGSRLRSRWFHAYWCATLAGVFMLVAETASAALIDTLGHVPKIMALGDSITVGCCNPTVGYYQFLADDLTAAAYQFSMVGSGSAGGYNIEGHPGAWPSDLLNGILDPNTGLRSGGIPSWMAQSTPDIVLLHAGSNGVMPSTLSYDPATAQWGSQVADMRSLLDGIVNANPNAYVVLAQIIQTQTPRTDITEYNQQLALMAASYGNSHLSLVNMENILSGDPQSNYVDNAHPSAAGFEIMADTWYPALTPILDGTTSAVPAPPAAVSLLSGLVALFGFNSPNWRFVRRRA